MPAERWEGNLHGLWRPFFPSFLLSSGVSTQPHPLELRIQGPSGRWRTQGTIRRKGEGTVAVPSGGEW